MQGYYDRDEKGAPMAGERFKALSGALAARGASNPDALAAWIGRRKYGKKGMAALAQHKSVKSHSHSNIPWAGQVIELDWATWDAEHPGGGGGHSKAHDTASATAKATARRHMASKSQRNDANHLLAGYSAKSASQLKTGHRIAFGNKGKLEEHRVVTAQRVGGKVRLHTIGPDGKHHHQTVKPTQQVSYRPGSANGMIDNGPGLTKDAATLKRADTTMLGKSIQEAMARGASQAEIGQLILHQARAKNLSNAYDLSNDGGRQILMAGDQMKCPNCGYAADSATFDTSGGASGTSVQSQPEELRTQARGNYAARAGYTSQSTGVNGASSPNMGLANRYRDAVGLANTPTARRTPVRDPNDIVITRSATGTAVVRHRHGGTLIGEVGRGQDNSWRSLIDGKELSPHTHQRAALTELLGTWNSTALDPSRPAMPLSAPPRQTELMSQLGVSNIRAFATDPDGDGDNDDSTTGGDTDGDAAGGLNPKGKAIYAKLRAKGKSPKAALAMARMAQNAKAGQFGKAG
jgi:hypothetical protein